MDDRVQRLKSVEECKAFIKNALRMGRGDLASQARQRTIQLKSHEHGAQTSVELECLEAIYAYEEVLSLRHGRRIRASRTWQMVERHGIVQAAERAVDRNSETAGFAALAELGLLEFAFEAVILRHPAAFSPQAVTRAQERLDAWSNPGSD